jgi:hypothetical protein
MRNISTVFIEALVIGIMNATLFWSLKQLGLNVSHKTLMVITGALIHLIFEYAGGNEWWCRQTYKCP